jgi:hypothetical protein
MGLIYEIGKVNSELNNGVLGTLVSDTYREYHGYPGGFTYSNDLYPDNFGIDVDNGWQDILFIRKEVENFHGPKINAHFWANWQGYCWGVVEFLSANSYLEVFTNFGSITSDNVKNFKAFETSPFSTNSSVQFLFSPIGKIMISVRELFSTISSFDSQIQDNKLRFGIRVASTQFGFPSVNIVVWNFNSSWSSPPLNEFKYIFSAQRQKGLGLRLSGKVKLYDFYFV